MIKDMSKQEILSLLLNCSMAFAKSYIREGDFSTNIHFFNTKNSVNAIISIHKSIIDKYQLNLHSLIPNSEAGL